MTGWWLSDAVGEYSGLCRDWREVGDLGRGQVADFRLRPTRLRGDDDGGDRAGRLGMHDEDGDRRLELRPVLAVRLAGRPELEDEEVQAVLEPGVDRVGAGQPVADRGELLRTRQGGEEGVVGAGQVGASRELGGDRLVQLGRTDRGAIPSAAARRRVGDHGNDLRSDHGHAPPLSALWAGSEGAVQAPSGSSPRLDTQCPRVRRKRPQPT